MAKRDYYAILGVGRTVDEQGLKTAYRKLALKHHPDRNPGNAEAEEQFKEAAEAYSVLSDPQKRAAYDRYGHSGVQGAAAGFDPSIFADFSDILGDFFGFGDLFGTGARRRQRAMRGEDVRYDLELEFEDCIFGKSVDIQVPRLEECTRCQATGAEPGEGLTTCSVCRGRGEVLYQQGFLSIRRTCSQCGGSGKLIRKACTLCRGDKYLRQEKKLRVNIPPGVDDGTRLRLSHEGQPGINGGPPGDLYVVLRVKEHAVFERQGDDLHCIVPINVAQAALGTDVEILTFDGLRSLKIPEGTQSGHEFRLTGLGVPHVNSRGRGDVCVKVDVRIPAKLSREQKELFERLRDTLPAENEPQEKGLLDRVKDYFAT